MESYEACAACHQCFRSFKLSHEIHDKVYILIWFSVGYMSKMKTIKTFRDLLSFLTTIYVGSVIGLGNVEERGVAEALVFLAGVLML